MQKNQQLHQNPLSNILIMTLCKLHLSKYKQHMELAIILVLTKFLF